MNRSPSQPDPEQSQGTDPNQPAAEPKDSDDVLRTDKTRTDKTLGVDDPTLEVSFNRDALPPAAAPSAGSTDSPRPDLPKDDSSGHDASSHSETPSSAATILDATIAQDETKHEPISHGKPNHRPHLAEMPTSLGRYQIEALLGRGGMGSVYRAHDTQLDRKVALKVPKFETNTNSRLIDRFYREARSAANLAHPNLCPVFDVGEVDGTHYIAMALIKGDTLSSHIRNNTELPERFAAMTVFKIARAMQEAHGSGIIHRDLKPANIMIDHRKEPIVMDFGLACPDELDDDSRLTQEGALLGSPAYMSPEQLRGGKDSIGQGADIYALGVVLYEILSARLPFAGNGSTISMIGQILTEDPTELKTLRPDISTTLAQICAKAMAKNSAERYASMESFANDLERFLRSQTARKKSPGKESRATHANITQIQLNEQSKLVKTLCESKQFTAAVPILEQILDNPQAKNSKTYQWASATLSKVQTRIEEDQRRQASENSTLEVSATASTENDLFADLPDATPTNGNHPSTPSSPTLTSGFHTPVARKQASTSTGRHSRNLVFASAGLVVVAICLSMGAWYWLRQPATTRKTNQTGNAGNTKSDNPDPQPMVNIGERQRLPDRIMQHLDRDRDGFIATSEIPRAGKSILMRADSNGDEKISRKEIQNANPKILLQLLNARPDIKNSQGDQRPPGGPNGFDNRRTGLRGPGFIDPDKRRFDESKPRGGSGMNRPGNSEDRTVPNAENRPNNGQGPRAGRPTGGPPFGGQRSSN